MANTKDVYMMAELPYNWPTHLTALEGEVFVQWILPPSSGLYINNELKHMQPNEHGGKTAIYYVALEGVEALNLEALNIMKEAWQRIGNIRRIRVVDIDDNLTTLIDAEYS